MIMTVIPKGTRVLGLLLAAFFVSVCSSACAMGETDDAETSVDASTAQERDISDYLVAIEEEPSTVDFQCTTIYYTVAQNVFNRLVEMENDEEGNARIIPSLAKSWEISDDRRSYTFHLTEDVKFSNGADLTADDVRYTFTRLLTDPDSCNEDIVDEIVGASLLESGETDELEGFQILDNYSFTITLEEPFEAFLACLSTPGASIMDEETTREAGERFGTDPEWMIGTGPFILESWHKGEGMLLRANPDCWQGAPACGGLDLRFSTDPEQIRIMFENGELDILNLDDIGKASEYFLHGDAYEGRVYEVPRISMTYIALNESIEPLDDAKVRKALQLSLNRQVLLDAAYSGNGQVEQAIMPHGLYGFNPDAEEIPYDPDEAKRLLKEAGYPDGVDLTISISSASSLGEIDLIRAAVSMWEKAGIHVQTEFLNENVFMRMRRSGSLACYSATWSADYNDPDNFLYTFFGNAENTNFRSLCYPGEDIMERVSNARKIADADERIREYRELERIIVQEDAAWIPLFSRSYFYVASKRLDKIRYSWNGSVKNRYREMSVQEGGEE